MAFVRQGDHHDAMTHALGANATHGLPRNRKDIRRCIVLALADEKYGKWSDRRIAKMVRCSDKTVGEVRREQGMDSSTRTVIDKHGNSIERDVSELQNRGKRRLSAPVNTFHELPVDTRKTIKETLRVISRLTKEQYAFVRTWFQAELPQKPKEAEH